MVFACALFSWAVGSLLGQYISLFYANWSFPLWLYGLLLLFAVESVYYSAYVLSPRTPVSWRLLELGLMWLCTTIILRVRMSFPYPWWAFWRAVSDLEFLIPFGLTVFVWSMAGGFGQQIAKMARIADELGDQAASTISWEFESLVMKPENASIPLEYFLRRWVGFALLFACFAVAARRTGVGVGAAASPILLGGLYTFILGTGLFIQGSAYLYRLTTIWEQIKLEYPKLLAPNWMRSLLIICLAFIVMVNVIPVDFSPLTYDDLVRIISSIFRRLTADPPELLGPPDEDLSAPESGGAPSMSWQQLADEEPPLWAGIIAILYIVVFFGGIVLAAGVFVGFLIVTFAQSELERLRGLPKAAAKFYSAVREAVLQLYGFLARGFRRVKEYAGAKISLPKKASVRPESFHNRSPGRIDPLAQDIRSAYRQLVRQSSNLGMLVKPGKTPREFGQQLQKALPEQESDIAQFIETYHLARYSHHSLDDRITTRALTAAERILSSLQRIVRGKDIDRTTN